MTFTQYYAVWEKEVNDNGYADFRNEFNFSSFIQAWYAYRKLVDVDYEAGMECERCGPNPETVILFGKPVLPP